MSTTALVPDQSQQEPEILPPLMGKGQSQQGDDPTRDDPNTLKPEDQAKSVQLTDQLKQELMGLLRRLKLSWSPIRRYNTRRALKAFEFLKGNTTLSFDPDNWEYYDPITAAITGTSQPQDLDLYKFNNNIYQMLCLSLMAALSADVPKSRYTPDDADSELDITTARRASTMMAHIERQNKIKTLQKLELLHLWTGGCYFSYVRDIVDSVRFGVTKQPIIDLVDTEVAPDRYTCENCGADNPAQSLNPGVAPACQSCGTPLSEENFYPAVTMPIPKQVGTEEIPNSGTAMNVYGLLNVDAAPDAEDEKSTPMLSLEMEARPGAIRSAYPEAWSKIRANSANSGMPEAEADRLARLRVFSSAAARNGFLSETMVTYYRTWFTVDAFNDIDNKDVADELKKLFPTGCKLVSAGLDVFLEAREEKLTDKWTWCGTVRGMGLYPFAIGDAALDIQERINDTANIIHEHMDRNASPTVLVDADAIDTQAMSGKPMLPGTLTPVKRNKALQAKPLADLMFQPRIQVDAQIYSYSENLIMLAQMVSGVQPQIFGGSDPNVKTAQGQAQMLRTALGRLGLFWDQIREEHAARAVNAVKCMAQNMNDKMRLTIDGEYGSGYKNEWILLSEVQGTFHAEPESDQGFPATYAEMQQRLMDLLQQADNEFVDAFLSDPDNLKLLAIYILPPGVVLPNDAERSKVKRIIGKLSQEDALEVMGPQGPMYMPTVEPDPDFDDMSIIIAECKKWGQRNFELATTDPPKFENVRAYLRMASQLQTQAALLPAVQQKMLEAQAGAQPAQPGAPQGAPQSQPGAPQ